MPRRAGPRPARPPVEGHFGLLADGTTAVVETAEASGLALLEAKERNPLIASSYGTGELMLAAVRSGAKRIIVGLGGSATNDAGAGLLQALGVRLLDGNGNDLKHGGAALADLATIDISTMDPALKNVAITAACDVTNPLTGPTAPAPCSARRKVRPKMMSPHWTRPRAFCAGNRQPARRCRERRAGCRRGRWHRCSTEGLPNAEFRPGIASSSNNPDSMRPHNGLTWCSPARAPSTHPSKTGVAAPANVLGRRLEAMLLLS